MDRSLDSAVRVAVVTGAAVALVLLAGSLQRYDRCQAGRTKVFDVLLAHAPVRLEEPGIRAVQRSCRSTDALLAVAAALHAQGRRARSVAMLRDVVRREPANAVAWGALADTAGGAEGARALARARALSPLGLPARPPAAAPPAAHPGGPDGGP